MPGYRRSNARPWQVEFYIFFEIKLSIVRIGAELMVDIATPGDRALGKDCRRRAADEASGLADLLAPERGSERRVMDLADESR
jgi:hypothetical protein